MGKNDHNNESTWVDPDDAPELTGEELNHPSGVWRIGDRVVSAEEGKAAFREALRSQEAVGLKK